MPMISLQNMGALQDKQVEIDHENFALRNIPIIQTGPALGHGFEIDDVMLAQVVRHVNAKSKGVKVHLTHPGLTACGGKDGLEVLMGRAASAKVVGDKVRADFQLGRFASISPQGDLRAYLLAIAEEDPELAGVSIQFDADEPEYEIVDEPRAESQPSSEADGKHVVTYARAKNVMAADFVGSPAANRDGLLDRLPASIKHGITPELLNRWAEDLKLHVAFPNPAVAPGSRAGLSTGDSTMKFTKALRNHLQQNHGLKADATSQEILTLLNALPATDRVAALVAGGMTETDLTNGGKSDPEPKPASAPAANPTGSPAPGLSQADIDARVDARLNDDKNRQREIYALAKDQGLGDDWALNQIMDGKSLSQAKDAALAKWKEKNAAEPGLGNPGSAANIIVGDNLNLSSIGPAMTDALCLRSGVNIYEEVEDHGMPTIKTSGSEKVRAKLHDRATSLRGMKIKDLHRQWLAAHGATNVWQLSDSETFRMLSPRYLRQKMPNVYALAQSTGDFSNILVDAVNKNFRSLYLDQPNTWSLFCRMRTAADFKTIYSIALSEAPDLQARAQGGEVRYVELSDSKETYTLSEYVGGLRITKRTYINDDLDALSSAPLLQAIAARRKEEDVAYAIFTGNAAMADGGNLFNSTAVTTTGGHANLVSGSANIGAPGDTTINQTNLLMRKQKGPENAAYLDIRPRFMLAPLELEVTAQKWHNNNYLPGGTNEEDNIWQGKFQPIANQRLSDDSTTAWYLIADYREGHSTIEIAFLEGEQIPQLAQETDFDTDDMKMKVVHTVAAKAIDWRTMCKNPGA
jgi:hypothetical protein